MEYDPQNRRRRGRPGNKWIDGIRETMIDRAIEEDERKQKFSKM